MLMLNFFLQSHDSYRIDRDSDGSLLSIGSSENEEVSANIHLPIYIYPTGRKSSLEFKFRYFANGKFAKIKFCLLLYP